MQKPFNNVLLHYCTYTWLLCTTPSMGNVLYKMVYKQYIFKSNDKL